VRSPCGRRSQCRIGRRHPNCFDRLIRTAEQHGGRSDVIFGEKMRGIQANACSSALASRRSAVSKPSLNQP
jgi:hypothetical protein